MDLRNLIITHWETKNRLAQIEQTLEGMNNTAPGIRRDEIINVKQIQGLLDHSDAINKLENEHIALKETEKGEQKEIFAAFANVGMLKRPVECDLEGNSYLEVTVSNDGEIHFNGPISRLNY